MKGWIVDAGEWKSGQTSRIAFFCDPHVAIEEDNRTLKAALDEAKNDGCSIWVNGDVSDWIYYLDKRYTPAREQKRKDNPEDDTEAIGIIDNAVEFLSDFFAPYASIIDGISYGNHETTAIKKYLTNPIRRVCHNLKIRSGAYRQIVRYRWRIKSGDSYSATRTLDSYIHHGKSGVAVMNKGILALRDMYLGALADIYIVGHGHRGIIDPGDTFYYMDRDGNIKRKHRKGMQIPGFQTSDSKSGREYEDMYYRGTPTGYGLVEVKFGRADIETECRIRIKD